MMRVLMISGVALLMAACATPAPPSRPQTLPMPGNKPAIYIPPAPAKIDKRGLGDVLGKGVGDLKRMFGEPRIDVIEVSGRKLQFSGKACILDAYLYPEGKGGAEVVTHVDARRSDGAEVDRAACVDALTRR
jgi:hypothetical protein